MSQLEKPTVFTFTPTIHTDTYPFIDPTKADLSNRTVLITGASKGIGRATAISFARAGARIIIAARSSLSSVSAEIESAAKSAGRPSPQILSLNLDVSNEASVKAAAEKIKSEFGSLDILINNAGFLEQNKKIAESDVQDWWRGWEVNIKGTYIVTRAMLPLLLSTPNGLKTILNLSSVGAHIQIPGSSGYQIGKLALLRFSEFVMTEYGDQGILCFAVSPGAVMTDMAAGLPKEILPMLLDTPEMAGDSMVWLSGFRRDWLAGRYVSVTWDMEELEGMRAKIEEGDLLKVRIALTL